MHKYFSCVSTLLFVMLSLATLSAGSVTVNSLSGFSAAERSLPAGDTIIWANGTYANAQMIVSRPGLTVLAETPGGVVFNGWSRLVIQGDNTVFSGVQFVGGDIGTAIVVVVRGADNVSLSQINIRDYTCYKYLVVEEDCQFADISYCNFERRTNYADKNILSVLISPAHPGFHAIRHCSFKNFPGGGADEGVEPIRIGTGKETSGFNSRNLVEYCYFTRCNGDGEIISSKGTQNVYRFNTFKDNEESELVLRGGSENIVYGNFFLDGKGGVRIKEGQGHYVYNNYFYRLDERSIILQDHPVDPLDDINIAFNTIVDCAAFLLNGTQNPESSPTNVTLTNNLFVNRQDRNLFQHPTGTETWRGNLYDGPLGMEPVGSGLTPVDAQLDDDDPFPGLTASSPAIDAAVEGFKQIPQYAGMVPVDTSLVFDILRRMRPEEIGQRDVGALEYPTDGPVRPFATEENTGPAYNSSILVPGLGATLFRAGETNNLNTGNTAARVSSFTRDSVCEALRISVTDPENAPLPPFNAYEFTPIDDTGNAITDFSGRVRVTLRVWSARSVVVSGLLRSGGGSSGERSDLKSQTIAGNSADWTEVVFTYAENELAGLDPTNVRDFWLYLDRGTENFNGNEFVIDDITFGGQRDPAFDSPCGSLSVPEAPRERFLAGREDLISRNNTAARVSTFLRDDACETLRISVSDPVTDPLPPFNAYAVKLIDDAGNVITDLTAGVRVTLRVWSAEDVVLSGLFLPGNGNRENRTALLSTPVAGRQPDWTEVTFTFTGEDLGGLNPADVDDFWFYLDRGTENFAGNNFIIDDITFIEERDPTFNSPCMAGIVTDTRVAVAPERYRLYPTLTHGALRWSGPEVGIFRIFDALGRSVARGQLRQVLDVGYLPAGSYWLLAAGASYRFIRR